MHNMLIFIKVRMYCTWPFTSTISLIQMMFLKWLSLSVKTTYNGKTEKAATFAETLTLFLLVYYNQNTSYF